MACTQFDLVAELRFHHLVLLGLLVASAACNSSKDSGVGQPLQRQSDAAQDGLRQYPYFHGLLKDSLPLGCGSFLKASRCKEVSPLGASPPPIMQPSAHCALQPPQYKYYYYFPSIICIITTACCILLVNRRRFLAPFTMTSQMRHQKTVWLNPTPPANCPFDTSDDNWHTASSADLGGSSFFSSLMGLTAPAASPAARCPSVQQVAVKPGLRANAHAPAGAAAVCAAAQGPSRAGRRFTLLAEGRPPCIGNGQPLTPNRQQCHPNPSARRPRESLLTLSPPSLRILWGALLGFIPSIAATGMPLTSPTTHVTTLPNLYPQHNTIDLPNPQTYPTGMPPMQPTLHMHQHPPGTSLSWASGMSDSNSENMQVALSDYISGGKRPYTPIPESQNLFPTKFRQHMPLKEWQLLSQNRISQRPPPSELSENFMVPIFTQTSQQNASDKFWNNDIFDDEDDIPIYERIGTTTNPSYMAFPNWWELKDHHYASILLNLRNGLMHRRDEAIRKRYKKQVQKIKDEIRNHNKQIFRERREDNERYHHVHEQTTFEDISTFIRDLERQLPSSTMKRIKKMESDLKRKHTPNILKIHREERRRERKQERKDEEMNRRLSKDVQQPYPSTEFNSNFNFTTTTTTNSSALPEPMDLPVTYHPDMQPKYSSQREHITYAAESLHSHDAIIQENPFPTEDSNAESDAEEMDMDAMSDDGMRSLVDSSEDEDEYTQRHGTRHYDISDEYDSDTDDTEYEDVFERILQHFRQHNSSTTTSSTTPATPATGITEMPTTTDKGTPLPTRARFQGVLQTNVPLPASELANRFL